MLVTTVTVLPLLITLEMVVPAPRLRSIRSPTDSPVMAFAKAVPGVLRISSELAPNWIAWPVGTALSS